MVTSREIIRGWLEEGMRQGATHMIVVCDTFDYEDYPSYVMPGEDVREEAGAYDGKNMQRIMEVYSFSQDIEAQLAQRRAFNYD